MGDAQRHWIQRTEQSCKVSGDIVLAEEELKRNVAYLTEPRSDGREFRTDSVRKAIDRCKDSISTLRNQLALELANEKRLQDKKNVKRSVDSGKDSGSTATTSSTVETSTIRSKGSSSSDGVLQQTLSNSPSLKRPRGTQNLQMEGLQEKIEALEEVMHKKVEALERKLEQLALQNGESFSSPSSTPDSMKSGYSLSVSNSLSSSSYPRSVLFEQSGVAIRLDSLCSRVTCKFKRIVNINR